MSDNPLPASDRLDGAAINALAAGFDACGVSIQGMVRAAVVVFETPRGIGWIEPQYIDPWGGPPAYHQVIGSVRQERQTLVVDGPEGTRAIVHEVRPEREGGSPEQAAAHRRCYAWLDWLTRQGRSDDDERQTLLEQMPDPSICWV